MSVKPRVFVSSVVSGFETEREAAREGIVAAGGEPVLVNEDFPARAASSRNVCLDAVDSCDIYIVIVGARGGWTTPSGKLVVEEEYERARQRRLPILVFVQRGSRDPDAERLLHTLSDYVTALFRREFSTPDELWTEVERSVSELVQQAEKPRVNARVVQEWLARPRAGDRLRLRFVILPEREEEVVDLVRLGNSDLRDFAYEIAHRRDVGLLSHEAPKQSHVTQTALQITQAVEDWRSRDGRVEVHLDASGMIAVEAAVTSAQEGDDRREFAASLVILQGDVERVLRRCFAFADAWYGELDPHRRHQRFHFGVALTGLGYRRWAAEVPRGGAVSMGTQARADPFLVYERPRMITYQDLARPDGEIERVLTLASRTLG